MKTSLLKPLCVAASLFFVSFTYSQTVIVSKCNMNGWHLLKNNGNNDAFLDLNPGSAPGAPGSGRLQVGKNGDTYASFTTGSNYKQTLLSTITELKYSTFVQQNGGKNLAPFISLDVDTDGDAAAEDTWIFEPASQATPVVLNTWQTWNALSGKWYSSKGLLRSGPGAKATTLAALIQAKPSARLLNAHTIQFMAGTKKNTWEEFDGNIDNVIIGVNNQSTTFDLVCNNSGTPAIVCPAGITSNTDPGVCSANIQITTPVASDACGNPISAVTGVRNDGAALTASYPKGITTITWTATDGSGATISCTQTIIVVDNEVPVITCPALASNDRNTDPGVCSYTIVGSEMDAQASDNCGATLTYELTGATTGSGGSTVAGVVLNKGTTTITWTATDGTNAPVTCHFDITVLDNQPPEISEISATPNILWSPNHKMVDVYLDYTIKDNCGTVIPEIFLVSSDEDENGLGDGNTEADWEIVDAHHVRLRAERSGLEDGRIYTIKIRAKDDAGLEAYGSVTVSVPHDQSSTAQESSLDVVYAPNPTSHSFILSVNSSNTTDKVSIIVTNSSGNIVYRNTNFAAGETISFGSSFPTGTYYAEIKQAGKTKHVTLLKL
jgi:hypothetical protein